MARTLEELAFDLAEQALARQEGALEDLRARTATLLTATALVVSFLGARTLDHAADRGLALTGFAFALGCVVLCVSILAPRRNIRGAMSGAAVHAHFVAAGAALDEAYAALARWLEYVWYANQTVIRRLDFAFDAAALMLVASLALWSLGLAID